MAAPPSRVSADHANSGLALACDIGPTKNIKDLTSLNNDFINVNPSTSVEAQFQNSRVKNFARFDCKVILKDVFEGEPTEKSNALKAHQDNNHSVFSRRFSDKDFLEQSAKKQPIAWPKMSDEDSWCLLDSADYSRLVGVSSIQEKVELLETTIYDQASRLFGHPVPPFNCSKGLNRRSRMSIKLCIEKNSLKNQINISVMIVLNSNLFKLS